MSFWLKYSLVSISMITIACGINYALTQDFIATLFCMIGIIALWVVAILMAKYTSPGWEE